jgi:LPXTG-motif cell wall-anchored protein
MEAWDNLLAATGATTDQLLFGLGVIIVSLVILLVRSKVRVHVQTVDDVLFVLGCEVPKHC